MVLTTVRTFLFYSSPITSTTPTNLGMLPFKNSRVPSLVLITARREDILLRKVQKLTTPPPSVFAGHDASHALGKTSTKPEDVKADWSTLDEKEQKVLADWETFFTKRYNIIGIVAGATNL